MFNRIVLAIMILLIPSIGMSAETIAKVSYANNASYSVISEGTPWENSCKLRLQVKSGQNKKELNIKRQDYGCLMLGPVQLYVSIPTDSHSTIIYLEAERGDDSGSSGPIIEVFESTDDSLKKLGEYEVYDAVFHRKKQHITSVTGNAIFSLCVGCDYPVSLNEEDNFYIPVTMQVTQKGLSIKSTLKGDERKRLLTKFDTQVNRLLKSDEPISPSYASKKRKKMEALLSR